MPLHIAASRSPRWTILDGETVDRKIRDLARRGMENPNALTAEEVEQACFALHVLCCLSDREKRDPVRRFLKP